MIMILQGLDPGRALVFHVENVELNRCGATGAIRPMYALKPAYDVRLTQITRLVDLEEVSLMSSDPEMAWYIPWVWQILH